jgi:sucrose phosphorylase
VHSLFGSHNDHIGVKETGRARSINREKWLRAEVEAVLANPQAYSHKIFQRYVGLLQARAAQPAFHPNGSQQIIPTPPALFVLRRTPPLEGQPVWWIHNISGQPQVFAADLTDLALSSGHLTDILSGQVIEAGSAGLKLPLAPYQVRWLVG